VARVGPVTASDLYALLALQDHDSRIDQERHHRGHLGERTVVAGLDSRLGQLRSERREIAGALDEVEGRLAAAEAELAATEERIALVNKRLYGGTVSASRELQAMAGDVEGLRRRASDLEDKVIALLDERAPLEAKVASLDQCVLEAESEREAAAQSLARAEAEVDAVLGSLAAGRPALSSIVPADLLAAYEKLRSRLAGVAVARLVGGRCDGCHLSLPAVEMDRIRHKAEPGLEHCDQCGRILVVVSS